MFGLIGNLAKAATSAVVLPVSLVADVVTLGGVLTDKDKPYTVTNIENLYENLENAIKPE